ncbi:hypothetical protein J6TS2_08230 [Heyndrickxia sporothermodurans]|nr:hypothetical protein J6TS2_08230 [Heyndrickxia sporothermodurans]
MPKKYFIILLFGLILVSGCSDQNKVNIQISKNETIVYGNYENGEYYLNFADQHSLKTKEKVKIASAWTDIIQYQGNKIWIPLVYKPDMTNGEDQVVVIDLNNKKKKTIKVGNFPHYIFFNGENTYVICEEDGVSPTLYQIDKNFNSRKIKTIKNGGLIFDATFDGRHIYLLTNHVDDKNVYPMINKINLDGEFTIQSITKENIGTKGLFYTNNKLIIGMQDNDKATLGVFDSNTLKKINTLNYNNNMVGQILPLDKNMIAVTNYSELETFGNKISIINIKDNKILKEFDSKNFVSNISYIDEKIYSVDNDNNTLVIMDKDGDIIKKKNISTEVSNIYKISKEE